MTLKKKILFGIPIVFFSMMAMTIASVTFILGRQNQNHARNFEQSAFQIIRHSIQDKEEKLKLSASHIATTNDLGANIQFIKENSPAFGYEVLKSTYKKIASSLSSMTEASGLWKTRLYDDQGRVLAFVDIDGSVNTTGIILADGVTIDILNDGGKLSAPVEVGQEPGMPAYAMGFAIIENNLSLVARFPVTYLEYSLKTGKNEQVQMGLLLVAYKLDDQFAKDLSRLTSTDVAFFTGDKAPRCIQNCSGPFLNFNQIESELFAPVVSSWNFEKQPLDFSDVTLNGIDYMRGILPIYSGSKYTAAIVSLYSKEQANRNVNQIIFLIQITFFVCLAIALPLVLYVSIRTILRPIAKLALSMEEITRKKDFTYSLDAARGDEIGELTASFNEMIKNLRETTTSIDNLNSEIAERKKVEDKLSKSNQELEQFAYAASHDLQEPLRMIASYIDLLNKRNRDKFDQDSIDFIHYAVDGAARMRRLINDLLAYSRLGTKGKPFIMTDCGEVLAAALKNLEIAIKEIGASIHFSPLPQVNADGGQLIQLFQNIIGNALKFCKDRIPEIRVTAVDAGEFWQFAISDNGIGIDQKYFDKIFQIFQRLHSSQEYQGTGIGLAVCKKIVERHGGKIWVESKPGEGTTFFFTIPKNQVSEGKDSY
jgi:signal transduction histidine kinase